MAAVSPLIPPPCAKAEEAVKSAMMSVAQPIIFLLRFIVYHFNVIWNTKFVLKTCAIPRFYAGGKLHLKGSVNRFFFGVNIVLFILSRPSTVSKVRLFSIVSHYLSVLRAVIPKSLHHVLIVCRPGNPGVVTSRLAVDF